MPNITTRLGQYCIVHGYEHKEEYLECDFCNEHKDWICLKTDITTMAFQSVVIMHAMSVANIYLVHLD
jgi:hypothetical protein